MTQEDFDNAEGYLLREGNIMEMTEVAEVVETRLRGANDYLAHGYHLLGVQNVSGSGMHPDQKTYYVRRQLVYVLGRPAEVKPYHPPAAPARTFPVKKETPAASGRRSQL